MGSGSIRLFRLAGIQVFLHFSWFLVAAYQVQSRVAGYHSRVWALYEYLALFAIVLMHEFGHALACRQTGGIADRIVLWPLGGVAFVSPPRRPGAVLWSIVAGPLVNVVLAPVLWLLLLFATQQGWRYDAPDAYRFLSAVQFVNLGLLIFNILPIYPLDGGQILRALLWFPFGEIRSLQVASAIGLLGGALLAAYALYLSSIWVGVLAFFLLSRAVAGWQHATALAAEADAAKTFPGETPPPRVI
jgi:Zn-dependent protease